ITSIPASRSARAMILAPRSCPSRPGFAITTRSFDATMQVYEGEPADLPRAMKLTVVGCSPAWPNPGGAQSGYMVEGPGRLLLDCGPGVLARLRERDGWPRVDAIAITHFHLDHWGDLVPWVWGSMYLMGRGDDPPRPQVFVPPNGVRVLEDFGTRLGFPDMFERVFELAEYSEERPFEADGHMVQAFQVPHYRLDAYALRVTSDARTLAYSGD